MPNIYITDDTKKLLAEVSELDERSQTGEISYLLKQRRAELTESKSTTPKDGGKSSTG